MISFNRYNAWYSNPGRMDMITDRVLGEADAWNKKYNKPILISEYGADTMPGLHEVKSALLIAKKKTALYIYTYILYISIR